jgi:hypothetical protein
MKIRYSNREMREKIEVEQGMMGFDGPKPFGRPKLVDVPADDEHKTWEFDKWSVVATRWIANEAVGTFQQMLEAGEVPPEHVEECAERIAMARRVDKKLCDAWETVKGEEAKPWWARLFNKDVTV